MTRKKAQIKMGETIVVLIIFFFLLVFGISFFMSESRRTSEQKLEKFTGLDSIAIAQLAGNMPELQCGISENKNCFDLLKTEAFSQLFDSETNFKEYYYDYFKSANITIEYYKDKQVNKIIVYDNVKENYNSIEVFKIPIVVLDEKTKLKYFGVLYVRRYI